ncbi:MAG: SH3 domain-containing protein [Clostridia bacterium]|nr:SH3 domain-containing protein [Clostridia bacterium]
MKKLFFFLVLMLALTGHACAQADLCPEAAAVFRAQYPSYTISTADQCGKTAAAVLTEGDQQVLCLAEEVNGNWQLTVNNPTALWKNSPAPSLLLDTDITLFWSYSGGDKTITYHASKGNGRWIVSGLMNVTTLSNQNISEHHLTYSSGMLHYMTWLCDENENYISSTTYQPVPAAWLAEHMDLTVYDDVVFPDPYTDYTHSWLSAYETELAAAELFPEYTCLGGCAQADQLEFLLQKPSGELVFAVCRYQKDKWKIVLSSPLPHGTFYGWENFSSVLCIGDLLVDVSAVDADTFGVTYIYNTADNASGEVMFQLGRNWVADSVPISYHCCFGDHPWYDITLIDWNSLPHSFEEAVAALDASDWAVVSNPNPEDRLHLRVKPDRGAKSLGKYYNGTPVRILEEKGIWARVNLFGVEGWMMTKYLAAGSKMQSVEPVFPARIADGEMQWHSLFETSEATRTIAVLETNQIAFVLGVIEDEWYHIWLPDLALAGYVQQSEWWEGNG